MPKRRVTVGQLASFELTDGTRVAIPSGSRYIFSLDQEIEHECPLCSGAIVDVDIADTGLVASVCPRCKTWFS